MSAQTNKLLGIIILLMACLTSGCSSNDKRTEQVTMVLEPSSQTGCLRGFIRPPGVNYCINIADIIAGETKIIPPVGHCPADWKRLEKTGFCLPKYSLIGCGEKTFSCEREENDCFRVIPKLPNCSDGTLILTIEAPMFNKSRELFLQPRQALMCGPMSKGNPVF